jgi:hypothetical protein
VAEPNFMPYFRRKFVLTAQSNLVYVFTQLNFFIKKILILVLTISSFITLCFAGAWIQPKGKGLNILTTDYYLSDKFRNSRGVLEDGSNYKKLTLSNFLEYGASKRLTLGFYFSSIWVRSDFISPTSALDGRKIFARYEIYSAGSAVVSVEGAANFLGPGARVDVPPKNSSLNTSESIQYGTSGTLKALSGHWFFDSSIGIIQRHGAGTLLQLIAQGGLKLKNDKLWFFLQDYNTFSARNIASPSGVNYNLVTIVPSILYWVTNKTSLQLGYRDDIYGQNVGVGHAVFLSLWHKF